MQARNNHGKYVSLKNRVIPIVALLVATIVTPLALYPGEAQVLESPIVTVVHAQEPIYKQPSIDQMLVNAFGKKAPLMRKIMMCESGGNPNARNAHSTAVGLFQVMASVHGQSIEALKDPAYNIWYAQKLFLEQGVNPWTSSRSCWGK